MKPRSQSRDGYFVATILYIEEDKDFLHKKNSFLFSYQTATFYDLKVTFGYIGESPENFMSKYTQAV